MVDFHNENEFQSDLIKNEKQFLQIQLTVLYEYT